MRIKLLKAKFAVAGPVELFVGDKQVYVLRETATGAVMSSATWKSSDPAVFSVNPSTGEGTVLGEGEITLVANFQGRDWP